MSGSFTLLPGEEVYLESVKVPLIITSFRVCHRYRYFPDPQHASITLESIDSTGLRTFSQPWLLILAGLLFLMTLIAVVLVVIYFLTRRRTIVVESAGSFLMKVPVRQLSLEECYFMLQAIDRAKLEFLEKVAEQS